MSIILGLLLVVIGIAIGVTLTVTGLRQLCLEGRYMLAKRVDSQQDDGSETVTYRLMFNHVDLD